jgi:uncharacterized protein YodC (DUF2158 family)
VRACKNSGTMRGMAQFKVGDVVQLKSGGPKMTVEEIRGDGLLCCWFAGAEKKFGDFPADALETPQKPREFSSRSGGEWS